MSKDKSQHKICYVDAVYELVNNIAFKAKNFKKKLKKLKGLNFFSKNITKILI